MFARFVNFKSLAFLHEYVNMPGAFWSAGKSGARFAPPWTLWGSKVVMEVERVIQGDKRGNTNSAWYDTVPVIQTGNIQRGEYKR